MKEKKINLCCNRQREFMKWDLETSEDIHRLIVFNYSFNTDTTKPVFNMDYCEYVAKK